MIRPLLSSAFMAGLLAAPALLSAQGSTTYIVTSSADDANARDANVGDGTCADANGDCTLRAAIDEANATSGKVVIVLPGRLPGGNSGTYIISRTAPNMAANTFEDDNEFGDFDIGGSFSDLSIRGTGTPGPSVTSSPNDRIFDVKSGIVNFSRITITGGKAPAGDNGSNSSPDAEDGADGGGIRVQSGATVNLDQVNLTQNVTGSGGNGAVPGSSLSSRTGGAAGSGGDGGALYIATGATVNITRSVISGNGTGDAGGAGAALGLNSEPATGGRGGDAGNGGGIYNAGTLTVTSSTITANTQGSPSAGGAGATEQGADGEDGNGGSGGGIANAQVVDGSLTNQGTATLTNTIVAGNTAGDLISNGKAPGDDLFDATGGTSFTDGGNLLIGSNESVDQVFAQGALVGTDASPVDALFEGQNANQDFAIPVFVLASGSPAIDAGSTSVSNDFDGRGFVRPESEGGTADIGAYEANSTDAPVSVRLVEIDVNTSTGNDEFVEIENTGDYPVQADDLVLVGFDGSGGSTSSCFAANLYGEIAPGELFTVGDDNVSPKDQPLGLDVLTSGGCGSSMNDQFANLNGAVAIYTGAGGNFTSFEAGAKSAERQDVIVYNNPSDAAGGLDDKNNKSQRMMDLCGAFGLSTDCAATDTGDGSSIQRDGNGGFTSGAPTPGVSGAPVPVTWLGVEAFAKTRNTATVAWRTAAEWDNAGFGVERLDDEAWTQVARIESLGDEGGEYAVDVTGLPAGEHLFRIRQDDYDGLRTYSPTLAVTLVGGGGVRVFPNPAREVAYLGLVDVTAGPVVIEVMDALGRQVGVQRFEVNDGDNQLELSVGHLPAANYFLRVQRDGSVETLRLERR